jgi:hypothetical protein
VCGDLWRGDDCCCGHYACLIVAYSVIRETCVLGFEGVR